jgi:hypothetical protein
LGDVANETSALKKEFEEYQQDAEEITKSKLGPLSSTFSVESQTTTMRLPLVGYGGSLLVESRKNGQIIR